jgi:hypothetical protein
MSAMQQGGAAVARRAHNPEVAGSNPAPASPCITFHVPGIPKPAGSKRGLPVWRGKKGEPRTFTGHVAVVDSSGQAGKNWRAVVQLAAREAHRHDLPGSGYACARCGMAAVPGGACAPLTGPLRLSLAFSLPRPKGHSGARGLRPSAPAYPTTKPDATKLLRAVEDACTGILWHDDAQIVLQTVRKLYASAEGPGVLVEVEPLT